MQSLGGEPCQAVGIYIIYIWLEFYIPIYCTGCSNFVFPFPKIQPWLILIPTPGFDNDRRNEYDGEEEFWVTTKEHGKENGIYVI